MKRWIVAGLLVGCATFTHAGEFEKGIKSRWLGAWVLTNIESYSHCSGLYTNNRVNGEFVKSDGSFRFLPGELVKLNRLDIKRSRLDLQFSVAEPLLVPFDEGPFTLYREASCQVEFEVVLDREVVKNKDSEALEAVLLSVFERFAREADALDSENWNGRERDPYPDDYEQTLAALEIWRVEQTNRDIDAKLSVATHKTYRLTDRVTSDPFYLAGFAVGVEEAKSLEIDSCQELLAVNLEELPGRTTPPTPSEDLGRERNQRGFNDGKLLIVGLELLRRLPDCYLPVPDGDGVMVGSNR